MAITNNGTQNLLNDNDIPSGYTRPTVVTFTDAEYFRTLNLVVLKSTVHNVDPIVTMQNIIADATIGITNQITDILAADYLATATVTAYADWTNISNTFSEINGEAVYLTNAAAEYECTVTLYVKTA